MSSFLFIGGLCAWTFGSSPHVGCLMLATAWLIHNGGPD